MEEKIRVRRITWAGFLGHKYEAEYNIQYCMESCSLMETCSVCTYDNTTEGAERTERKTSREWMMFTVSNRHDEANPHKPSKESFCGAVLCVRGGSACG